MSQRTFFEAKIPQQLCPFECPANCLLDSRTFRWAAWNYGKKLGALCKAFFGIWYLRTKLHILGPRLANWLLPLLVSMDADWEGRRVPSYSTFVGQRSLQSV